MGPSTAGFFLSVAEVNALNSHARAKKTSAAPTLIFRKNLARQMINNKLNNDGITIHSPNQPKKRSAVTTLAEHDLLMRPENTGAWDENLKNYTTVMTRHMRTKCATCKNLTRTYCSCNKKVSMGKRCYLEHWKENNNY